MHVACFVDVKRFFIIFHYIAIVKVFSYKNGTGLIWRVGRPPLPQPLRFCSYGNCSENIMIPLEILPSTYDDVVYSIGVGVSLRRAPPNFSSSIQLSFGRTRKAGIT